MIKVEVIEDFTFKDFAKVEDLKRATSKEKVGYLFVGDTFKCDKEICDYLLGDNPLKKAVVKVIEVEPKKKEVKKEEQISEELERKVKEQEEKIAEVEPKIIETIETSVGTFGYGPVEVKATKPKKKKSKK